jgi:hypothetical protein
MADLIGVATLLVIALGIGAVFAWACWPDAMTRPRRIGSPRLIAELGGLPPRAAGVLVGEFNDAAVRGADHIEARPGFAAMLAYIASNVDTAGYTQSTAGVIVSLLWDTPSSANTTPSAGSPLPDRWPTLILEAIPSSSSTRTTFSTSATQRISRWQSGSTGRTRQMRSGSICSGLAQVCPFLCG